MKKIILIIGIILLIVSAAVLIYFNNKEIKSSVNSLFSLNSFEHGLTCNELPSAKEVRNVFETNLNMAIKVAEINGDEVKIDGLNVKVKNTSVYSNGLGYIGHYVSISVYEYANNSDNLSLNKKECEDKADIKITITGKDDFDKVKQLLGSNFFGVPYRIINI